MNDLQSTKWFELVKEGQGIIKAYFKNSVQFYMSLGEITEQIIKIKGEPEEAIKELIQYWHISKRSINTARRMYRNLAYIAETKPTALEQDVSKVIGALPYLEKAETQEDKIELLENLKPLSVNDGQTLLKGECEHLWEIQTIHVCTRCGRKEK